jgi:hypothetical protein
VCLLRGQVREVRDVVIRGVYEEVPVPEVEVQAPLCAVPEHVGPDLRGPEGVARVARGAPRRDRHRYLHFVTRFERPLRPSTRSQWASGSNGAETAMSWVRSTRVWQFGKNVSCSGTRGVGIPSGSVNKTH